MSATVILCPKCGHQTYGRSVGIATARWREHVITDHALIGHQS